MKVGVIGLGKVGFPLACTLLERAETGREIVEGWDVDSRVREMLSRGESHIDEPGVQDVLRSFGKRFHIMAPQDMACLCDVVYIVVPTPSLPDGSFSTKFVREALTELNEGLEDRELPDQLVVILVSTVSPGSCFNLRELIDAELVYAPTFIALGTVMRDLRFPRVQLIGVEGDPPLVIRLLYPNANVLHFMTQQEAEIAKLAFNAYLTLKITFANQIGQLAHQCGANSDRILEAIGADARIGQEYLVAGGTYGGPCLPRDNRALAKAYAGRTTLFDFTDEHNHQHFEFVKQLVLNVILDEPNLFHVVGLGYKYGVDHAIESFGDKLREELESRGWTHVEQHEADVIIIAQITGVENVRPRDRTVIVVDVWRCCPELQDKCVYIPFGG